MCQAPEPTENREINKMFFPFLGKGLVQEADTQKKKSWFFY